MAVSSSEFSSIYDEEKRALKIHDRKLDALEDLIESANGKPLLIAYWFQHDLQRIKERFTVVNGKCFPAIFGN